jgi:hypothetical protein
MHNKNLYVTLRSLRLCVELPSYHFALYASTEHTTT